MEKCIWEISELMDCLEQHVESLRNLRPETDVSNMDGAVLLNMLRPGVYKTFGNYDSLQCVCSTHQTRAKQGSTSRHCLESIP